jgi:hypothetical protein
MVYPDSGCLLAKDKNSILASSVILKSGNSVIENAVFIENDKIFLKDTFCNLFKNQPLRITFRVFPYNFKTIYTGLDTSLIVNRDVLIQGAYGNPDNITYQTIIDSEGLSYRGSFGRGLSVGNNQSFVLNSNFDLQLNGDIGNDIKVVAAISDENLPIQAQGNTQQLQEFDRVFIQLSKDKTSLIAGDFELKNGNGYFMQYFKKLKGISGNTAYNIGKNIKARTRAGFAISRGKFARQTLANQEGNQGPYKLAGNNNERFIIVLSGTEKVYFNGILLKRGFDLDYTIDYNRAEITFSPTRVVARDSRIIVEFEYTDVNYVRTLYELNTTLQGKSWEWNINMYSEQDSKSQTGNGELDSMDIRILEQSGNDLTKMVRSSIRIPDTTDANLDLILYQLVDNPLVPGEKILIFSNNPDSSGYTAVFTEVGVGKGDYEIDNTATINGRVYKYVGKNMGKYAPLIQLIPPEQKQLFTTGGYWQVHKKVKITGEASVSRFDVNTRSVIGNSNNTGMAGMAGIIYQTKLDSSGNWKFQSLINFEHVRAEFQALNPFRNAEFARDWNLAGVQQRADENIITGSLSLQHKSDFSIKYAIKQFDRSSLYSGLRHQGSVDWSKSFLSFSGNVSFLESENKLSFQKSSFFRPNLKLNIFLDKNKNWVIASELDAEENLLKNTSTNVLVSGSASYQHYKFSFGNNPEKKLSFKVGVNRRYDQLPDNNAIVSAAVADEIEAGGKWTSDKGNFFNVQITNRDLTVLQPDLLPTAKSTKSLIGKMEQQWVFLRKSVKTNWVYAVTSGQEPKIEYKFVKLDAGRGEFVYIGQDENPNLALVQDFRYNPSDPLANYIRVSLYNNEFIRTNNIELNQSVRIDLDKLFVPKTDQKKGKKKLFKNLSRFSFLSNARIQKRVSEGGAGSFNTYINFSRQDTGLVAYTGLYNNTLFFNRGNIYFDLQIGNKRNDSRVVQINGYEDRTRSDYYVKSRVRMAESLDFILNGEYGSNRYASKIFNTRDFDILFYDVFPEINYRPSQNSRLVTTYSYSNRRQTILGKEQSQQHKMTLEFNWRKASLFNIDVQVNYIKIFFTGEANSSIEYDMLEGLKNGNNYVWNVGMTRRIAKSLDLIVRYEGRKPGETPTIHVGQAQVKATF